MILWYVGFTLLFLFIYFLPSINAWRLNKKNTTAIFVLNLFLGWTLLGWVGALIWSVIKE